MKTTKQQVEDLQLKVAITVTPEDYSAEESRMLAERKRNADFKGFRKGMAPMALIKRVYGEQALAEAVNKAVSEALNTFIKDNKLRILGEPLTSDDQPQLTWNSGEDFTFNFDLGLSPEISFEAGADDKIPHYTITSTAQAKKEMKENMLRQFGSMQDTDKAGEDDFVTADLTGEGKTVEGAYIAVRKVAGDAHALFLGAGPGAEFEVNVNEAFTDEADRAAMLKVSRDELTSINPVFRVRIVTAKTFVPASESQETYDKIFGKDVVKSPEDFDKAVAERLADNYRQESDYRLSKDIKDHFLAKADVKLPETFLKKWLTAINEGKFTAEDIEKEFPSFAGDFKWQLVRDYLMEKYGLTVSEEEMHEAAEAFVTYQYAMYGMGNLPHDMIHDAAHRVLEDANQSRQVRDSVEDRKVIEALKEKITLTPKKISVEKFREL